jgi:FkbM family methyltransferase
VPRQSELSGAATARGRLMDSLPAWISLRLRSERNLRRVLGLHPPADLITELVPSARAAVDVGANRGIYTYWIHKRASAVDAFEPQPRFARYIREARLRGVRVHEVALSDRTGSGRLVVPDDDGLAHLAPTSRAQLIAETPASLTGVALDVATRSLDSFALMDVGFIKIDVEGHEMAVLRGGRETIERCGPVVFVESEARHANGAPGTVIDWMLGTVGYRRGAFIRRWKTVDIDEFSVERDQLALLPDVRNDDYVGNFVFWP